MTVDNSLPLHIAFIMDGNGRWAQQRGLPHVEGHRAGSKAMQSIVKYCDKLGIRYVTFYAFSTENWKRPKDEVDALMALMSEYLAEAERKLPDSGRLCILGDRSPLSAALCSRIQAIEKKTRNRTGITVNIAFNYGSRGEIVHAAHYLAEECAAGRLVPDAIDEQLLGGALYTAGQPDPDVIVRPSGEQRLSNFLLWQAAYAELIFLEVLWPDFDSKALDEVLRQYTARDRRFGGRK